MPTILITGASRGLGLEFVRQYANDGWHVIATCRAPAQASALQALARQWPAVRIEPLDVIDPASIAALAVALKDEAVDVLINGAGIYTGNARDADDCQSFGRIDAAAWSRVLHTNTIAPVMVTQALVPQLKRGGERKVIMMSSVMGSIARGGVGAIAYRTSKAALNMAAYNVAQAMRNDGIIVVSLHPGWVKTDMGGPNAEFAPETSIAALRKVIAGLKPEQSGQFLNYDGTSIPW